MLFHYTRTRKTQAFTLAINVLLLPVLLYLFYFFAKDKNNFEELFAVAKQLALAAGVILAALMLWFLTSSKQFELYVTEDEFYSMRLTFKEWCFAAKPKDIKSITHQYSFLL